MKKQKDFIKNVFYAIKYIYRMDPFYIFLVLLNVILSAFSSIFSIYSLKIILDVLSYKNIAILMKYLFIIFSISLIVDYFQSKIEKQWIELRKIKISQNTNFNIYNAILYQNVAIYDDKKYYDKIYLNLTQGLSNILEVIQNCGTLLSQVLSIIGIGIFVIQYDIRIIILILVVAFFSVMLNFFQSRLDFNKFNDMIYPLRIQEYTTRIIYLKQYAKELRMHRIFEVLKKRYEEATITIYNLQKKYSKKNVYICILQDILEIILQIVTIIILAYKYIKNEILFSDFLVLYNSSVELTTYIQSIFNVLPQFYKNTLYINKFNKLVETTTLKKEYVLPLNDIDSLRLKHITFSYGDQTVINNFSYTFYKGNVYRICGKNGTGKSTLLNIIAGLYTPQSGNIYINNGNSSQELLRKNSNILFQDGQLYALPLIYNILMRPLIDKKEDEKLVWSLLRQVGLSKKIETLPLNIYTPYTQELDECGACFSGGEIQKILLARSLANMKAINIYDESMSAMDSDSKFHLLNLIQKLKPDSIILFVSHEKDVKFDGITLNLDTD